MLYGKRTGTIKPKDTPEIELYYVDGVVTWSYLDRATYGFVENYAEETEVFHSGQGTYVLGYRLFIDSMDASIVNPNPRVLAEVIDTDIIWTGQLSPHSLDVHGLREGGELI